MIVLPTSASTPLLPYASTGLLSRTTSEAASQRIRFGEGGSVDDGRAAGMALLAMLVLAGLVLTVLASSWKWTLVGLAALLGGIGGLGAGIFRARRGTKRAPEKAGWYASSALLGVEEYWDGSDWVASRVVA